MTDHIKVDESFINALVKNAAWDAARVSLTEGENKGDKSKDKPEDKADFKTGARKGDKSKTHAGKDFEDDDDADEMKESVEEHTCPLCESHLEEALTDDQISEHVGQIQDALLSLEEEAEEDDEEDLEEEDDEEDLEEEEYDKMRDAGQTGRRGPGTGPDKMGSAGGKPVDLSKLKPKSKPSDDSDKNDVDEKKKKVMKKVKELKAASKGK